MSSSFAELEASIAALNISKKSENISTPLNATSNQRLGSDICVTGTPSLSGTRSVALNQSDESSLTITVTFGGDRSRKSLPCKVSEAETEIQSPRDKARDKIVPKGEHSRGESDVEEGHVSEIEKKISSPGISRDKDHDGDDVDAPSPEQQQNSSSEKLAEKSTDSIESNEKNHQLADGSAVDINDKVTVRNAAAAKTAGTITTTATQPPTKRDSSSVSDMELNRGSMTESPSANIFLHKVSNLSMTPLSELEQEADAKVVTEGGAGDAAGGVQRRKESSLLVSSDVSVYDNVNSDGSVVNESDVSESASNRDAEDETQSSVIESGAEDRISSANTSHNRSSLSVVKDSKVDIVIQSATATNANTSQCEPPREGTPGGRGALPQQVQRILDAHDRNSALNQSLSELDNMAADVEATSTPAAGKSKTVKVVNSTRSVLSCDFLDQYERFCTNEM